MLPPSNNLQADIDRHWAFREFENGYERYNQLRRELLRQALHGSDRSADVQSHDAHVLLLPGYARSERELAGSTTSKPRPLDVWSRALTVHSSHRNGRMRYGPSSSREVLHGSARTTEAV